MATRSNVNGRFSNNREKTFLCCSIELSWYALRPVILLLTKINTSSTRCTPFVPPNNSPKNLKSLLILSTISSGTRNAEPMIVRSKKFKNFERHLIFEKFYGSKSPWANFIPIIQDCDAIKVDASEMKLTMRAN